MANFKNSEFTRLLTQTAKAAEKHKLLIGRVNDECIARYGVDYGAVDADSIIDSLNYIGADSFTEKEFHDAMTLSNCERIDLIVERLKALPELSVEQKNQLEEFEKKLSNRS